ncbi:GNAT family N-acetyltransferase [Actinophytocola sp.]|uniref:GNAT family N-acetyltransferase n=1 Tax=Actinophytocola sp. TaxID=1872138 RepID=UPI00389A50F5
MALAESFYGKDTLRHTVALTAMVRLLTMERAAAPRMATLHDNGDLIGVALRTPPWPIISSGLPTDPVLLETFLTEWREVDPELPGASGPRENVDAVGAAWTRVTGGATTEVLAGRLYRLGQLTLPTVPGRARLATEDDIELLAKWRAEFSDEALPDQRDKSGGPEMVRRSFVIQDTVMLWEDGGELVSWANASTPIGGMSRVGPVYTPPEYRGRGYGSAVTAVVSQRARDAGARDVILFTNLANPTSNSIYQKMGYRPVYDSSELRFTRLPSTT